MGPIDPKAGPFDARAFVISEPRVDMQYLPTVQAQRDANCARGLPSVKKTGVRDARVAIVGFGPSLRDVWAQLAVRHGEFDAIWTVSKAHDFLIEHGVLPTHHTDTDFREYKARYNTQWKDEAQYLMATQVHPSYLDALAGRQVRLFHVVQPSGGTFDARYFKQEGQHDAGVQVAQLAYELGYRQQEWFGMDASMAADKAHHAGTHEGWEKAGLDDPNLAPYEVVADGKLYTSCNMLISQAMFVERMLQKRPKLKVKIHGDGALRPFLQARRKVVLI